MTHPRARGTLFNSLFPSGLADYATDDETPAPKNTRHTRRNMTDYDDTNGYDPYPIEESGIAQLRRSLSTSDQERYRTASLETVTEEIGKLEKKLAKRRAKNAKNAEKTAELESHLAKLRAEQHRLSFPKEPERIAGKTTLVLFTKTFGGPIRYEFAAIRPSGHVQWSLTGRRVRDAKTWHQLINYIRRDELHPDEAIAKIRVSHIRMP